MKSKIIYGGISLVLVLMACFLTYYFITTEVRVKQLSDNQTKLQASLDKVTEEYIKLASPKMFKTEEDLITWLDSCKDKTLGGYLSKARLDGVYMELWVGWVDGKTTISGIDFGENWKKTKLAITGVKYSLITIIDTKTFLVDPETRRIISVDLGSKDVSWSK